MSQVNDHAGKSTQTAQTHTMALPQGQQGLQNEPSLHTKGGKAVALRNMGAQKEGNKHNLDYVLKTGFAGGLAGCAVWRS